MKPLLLASALLLTAPYQCASDPDPERAMEDSAPKALWELSERFRAQGEEAARRETLRWLADRYPSSRYAVRADAVLGAEEAVDEGAAVGEESAERSSHDPESPSSQAASPP